MAPIWEPLFRVSNMTCNETKTLSPVSNKVTEKVLKKPFVRNAVKILPCLYILEEDCVMFQEASVVLM